MSNASNQSKASTKPIKRKSKLNRKDNIAAKKRYHKLITKIEEDKRKERKALKCKNNSLLRMLSSSP